MTPPSFSHVLIYLRVAYRLALIGYLREHAESWGCSADELRSEDVQRCEERARQDFEALCLTTATQLGMTPPQLRAALREASNGR